MKIFTIHTRARLFARLCGLWLLASTTLAWADEFQMYIGEVKTLPFTFEIDRVAVGNTKLISYSFHDAGKQLDLVALKEGDTLVQIWLKNGQKIEYKFFITQADIGRTSSEAAEALRNLPGIKVRQVGPNTLVEGRVSDEIAGLIDKVASKYPDIINLTIKGAGESSDEAITILRMIPGVTTRRVGKNLVVTGSVNADTKEALATVQNKYPEIINLTVEKLLVEDPMIFMNVKITEFGNNALKNLGIDWSTTFAGPSAAYARDWEYEGHPSVSTWNNQSGNPAIQGSPGQYRKEVDGSMKIFNNVRDAVGFFGIATMITSSINLAVNNGDALMLAEPTLSARSGGKAEFLAGGQIPIMVPQGDGKMSTEFKDYGITLNVEPKAGRDGTISSKVTAEVSSIDNSVSAQGVPGFFTRKAQTEVSMRNGQTLVISGLVKRELDNSVKKVAGLGDIPILGTLFKSTNFRNQKSDLVIFITPHIAGAKSEINKQGLEKAAKLRNQFLQNIEAGAEILD